MATSMAGTAFSTVSAQNFAPRTVALNRASKSASNALSSDFSGLKISKNAQVFSHGVSAARQRKSLSVQAAFEAGVGIMGNKVGMMTWFAPGSAFPVTIIGLQEGNIVTQVKTAERDGYSAVQVGYEAVAARKLNRPEIGHLKKAFSGIGGEEQSEEDSFVPLRHLREYRLQAVDAFQPGQQLKAEELFKEGDLVDVQGTSIGKGFQGGIKVHNFARGLMTHGSKSHRQLGSIGAGTTPGRVYPGKKMPKKMGNRTTKIRKLEIIKVDTELNAIIVKGSVPGKPGNLLSITPAKIVGKNIP